MDHYVCSAPAVLNLSACEVTADAAHMVLAIEVTVPDAKVMYVGITSNLAEKSHVVHTCVFEIKSADDVTVSVELT